jgi:D-alanyl-D-alanine carboxypeptidase
MHKLTTRAVIFAVLLLALVAYSNVAPSKQLTSVSASYIDPEYRVDIDDKADIEKLPVSAFIVFDVDTGEVFASKQADKPLPIASVTKLVTALAVSDTLDLEGTAVVASTDVYTEGRSGKINPGEKYTYRELLFPLLLESSNDVATVFERETQGGVVEAMNSLTKNLGTKHTTFLDASGLSEKNISTVNDLMIITSYIYRESSHILDITKLTQFVGPYTGWVNNNPVIDNSYLGGKHGYTNAANRTIVALFKEDFKAGSKTLGYIVLGSDNLKSDIATLREFTAQSIYFQ